MTHPELSSAPSFVAFLKADAQLFDSAKKTGDVEVYEAGDELEVYKPTDAERGEQSDSSKNNRRFPRLKRLASKIATKVALTSKATLERSDDEIAFDEIEDYLTGLDAQVHEISKQALAYVKLHYEQNKLMLESSINFSAIGNIPVPVEQAIGRTNLSTLFSSICDQLSNQALTELKRYDELGTEFEEPLKRLVRDVHSVRLALQKRRESQVDFTSRLHKVQAKEEALEQPTPSANMHNDTKAKQELEEAKKKALAAKMKFEEICGRVLREVERFRTEMRDKIRVLIFVLTTLQRKHNSMALSGWEDLHSTAVLYG